MYPPEGSPPEGARTQKPSKPRTPSTISLHASSAYRKVVVSEVRSPSPPQSPSPHHPGHQTSTPQHPKLPDSVLPTSSSRASEPGASVRPPASDVVPEAFFNWTLRGRSSTKAWNGSWPGIPPAPWATEATRSKRDANAARPARTELDPRGLRVRNVPVTQRERERERRKTS